MHALFDLHPTIDSLGNHHGCQVDILRGDILHPAISGNKIWKLKYHLENINNRPVLSFGGAYSNHIFALAAASKLLSFKSIGVIRGEKPKTLGYTLQFAKNVNMHLEYVSRSFYKDRNKLYQYFLNKYPDAIIIPEGGASSQGIKGCSELLKNVLEQHLYDYICLPVGTGATMAGFIAATPTFSTQIIGFSALKGDFLAKIIQGYLLDLNARNKNWQVISNYHGGGYAKCSQELVSFINQFTRKFDIMLDPIYTGKTVYGVFDLLQKEFFKPNTKILIVHTGGLQGIHGMEEKQGTPFEKRV